MTKHVRDFTSILRAAVEESRQAGLVAAADELEGRVLSAYTTGSEWLGEVGEAIRMFLRSNGDAVPDGVRTKLIECLAEVGKVWPKYLPS